MYPFRQSRDFLNLRPHSSLSDLNNHNSNHHHHHHYISGATAHHNHLPRYQYQHQHFHYPYYYYNQQSSINSSSPFNHQRQLSPSIRLLQSEQNLISGTAASQHDNDDNVSTKTLRSKSFSIFYCSLGNHRSMDQNLNSSELSEWLRFQPITILQLDPPDRFVLFIAGKFCQFFFSHFSMSKRRIHHHLS
mgnify:CR=1 FL=1